MASLELGGQDVCISESALTSEGVTYIQCTVELGPEAAVCPY